MTVVSKHNILNTGKTFLLMSLLTGFLLAMGFWFGGYSGALTAFFFAALLNFGSYWYSDRLVLRIHGARELGEENAPEIHQMVEKLSREAGIPKPSVHLVQTANPNAFATGRNPDNSAVAVTSGLVQGLNREEIEGVLAHEIGHIANRDTLVSTVAATLAGAITWLAHISIFFGGRRNMLGSLAMFLLAPIAASLVRVAISRSREFGADAFAGGITDPAYLASALRKIESIAQQRPLDINPSTSHLFIINPLDGSGVSGLFSTHPPVEARVERLRRMARE